MSFFSKKSKIGKKVIFLAGSVQFNSNPVHAHIFFDKNGRKCHFLVKKLQNLINMRMRSDFISQFHLDSNQMSIVHVQPHFNTQWPFPSNLEFLMQSLLILFPPLLPVTPSSFTKFCKKNYW